MIVLQWNAIHTAADFVLYLQVVLLEVVLLEVVLLEVVLLEVILPSKCQCNSLEGQ